MSYNGIIEVSCSDADFYQRKIMRLEDDIGILHQELTKFRAKLRIAQDYEIKYNILLKNSEAEISKLKESSQANYDEKLQAKVNEILRQKQLKWQQQQIKLQEKIRHQMEKDFNILREERDQFKRRSSEASLRKEQIQGLYLKIKKLEKQNQSWQQQIQNVKIHYQRQKENDLQCLKSNLNASFKQRMANERRMYEQKISSLQKSLIDKQVDKDNEVFKLPSSSNAELHVLKQLFEQKGSQHQIQIEQLNSLIHDKNSQIKKILQENRHNQLKFEKQLQERDVKIQQLSKKLFQAQKQFQFQLIEALQKSKDLRNETNTQYQIQIRQLAEQKEHQNNKWSQRLLNHDKEIEKLTKKYEQQLQKLYQDRSQLKKKVADLSNRLIGYEGDREAGETQQLIESLKDLQKKQNYITNYENGITFLERHLKKCQIKLEQKARANSNLSKEINNIRLESEKQVSETFQKMVQLKKEHKIKIVQLQSQILNLNQELVKRQKQIKRLQRESVIQKHENQIQMQKLKDLLQEVQKDLDRLVQNKKGVQENYRAQRQKALSGMGDVNINKKHKWMELQKQKKQLQTIYRLKEEQIRLKFQIQLDSKQNQLSHYAHQFEVTKKQIEILKKQNSKLHNELQENKQNLRVNNYQAKIATIDLQLAVTQNIYDNLIKIKSKKLEFSALGEKGEHDSKQEEMRQNTPRLEPLLFGSQPSLSRRQ